MAIQNGQTADADDINAELSALAADISALDSVAVKLSGNQTVQGVKTFGSIPVLPASDPTTDNQAVRKAYVDATAMTGIKFGTATHAGNIEETQNIAHGCGKTPKLVKIISTWMDWDDNRLINELETNGIGGIIKRYRIEGANSYIRIYHTANNSSIPTIDFDSYSTPVGSVSLNSTNISIVWTKKHDPVSDLVYISWEAIA